MAVPIYDGSDGEVAVMVVVIVIVFGIELFLVGRGRGFRGCRVTYPMQT